MTERVTLLLLSLYAIALCSLTSVGKESKGTYSIRAVLTIVENFHINFLNSMSVECLFLKLKIH